MHILRPPRTGRGRTISLQGHEHEANGREIVWLKDRGRNGPHPNRYRRNELNRQSWGEEL